MSAATFWLAVMAALVALVGWETDWGRQLRRPSPTPAPAAAPVAVALLPDFVPPAKAEALRETVERPAFVPTRRQAPPPPAQEPPKPRLQRGQFVLTGTAVVDKQAIAFLREAATGRARTVRSGDSINGLQVSEVMPDRVVLALGDESEVLALKVAAGPRTTIQPVVAPPGAPPPGGAAVPGTAAAPAPAPGAAPGTPAPEAQPADGRSLLERRRAARAAQAAAEAAASAGGAVPAAPVPVPPDPVPPAPVVPAPASPQNRGASQGVPTTDPGWAEVYRRMQPQGR